MRKTARLEVRPLSVQDYSAWKIAHIESPKAKNKWDVARKLERSTTLLEFKKLLSAQRTRRENDTFYSLGIFLHDGKLVGGISMMEVSRRLSQSAYLGYWILNSYWGQGLATEAVRATIDIAFNDLKLHRIEAGIEPGNSRSIALAKSLGMRKEGLKKRAIYLRSQWVDLLIFSLTCEDIGMKFKGKIPKLNT